MVDYEALKPGTFEGSLFVMWVGEGGPAGAGEFVYVPSPERPLTFRRTAGAAGSVEVIRPGLMYTDGGSIPRLGQVFEGFAPWGYAPAYMVHDWLFEARHCLRDGLDDGTYTDLAGVGFTEQAAILGEAIKTLIAENRVKPNDVAPAVITAALQSETARALWDREGVCRVPAVSDAHRAEIEAAFPGVPRATIAGALRLPPSRARVKAARPAKIVAVVEF